MASFQPQGVSGTLSPFIFCLGYTPWPEVPFHWWTLVTWPHPDIRGTGNHSPWQGSHFPVTVVLSGRDSANISEPLFFSITQTQKCCKVTQLLSGREEDLKPSLSKSTICPLNYLAFCLFIRKLFSSLKKNSALIYLITSNHTLQGRNTRKEKLCPGNALVSDCTFGHVVHTQKFWNDDNDVHSLLLQFWFPSSPSNWSFPGISML